MNMPDLGKVVPWSIYEASQNEDKEDIVSMHKEAREFLEFYNWCLEITEEYVGILYPGIVGVFLFRIKPISKQVDEWIWVVVGDLPPAYLTCEICPNPVAALNGYIGALLEWVDAAENGKSVANLIPVNVPATKDNAKKLKSRLDYLDKNILINYQDDDIAG